MESFPTLCHIDALKVVVTRKLKSASLTNSWYTSDFGRHSGAPHSNIRWAFCRQSSTYDSLLKQEVVSWRDTTHIRCLHQFTSSSCVYLLVLELHVERGCSQKEDMGLHSRLLMSWWLRSEAQTFPMMTTFVPPNPAYASVVTFTEGHRSDQIRCLHLCSLQRGCNDLWRLWRRDCCDCTYRARLNVPHLITFRW